MMKNERLIVRLKDDFGNSGTIEQKMMLPYNGASARVPGYVLTLRADYDCGMIYHVSCHESLGEALDRVKPISCGTFRVVSREEVAA